VHPVRDPVRAAPAADQSGTTDEGEQVSDDQDQWPGVKDDLPRLEGEPTGWHWREVTETGYPLVGSSPAERQESQERGARIQRQAMRDHPFVGEGPYCDARITTRPMGRPETGTVTGWVGCGYGRDTHPVVGA
jgi:hypothetical protein